MASGKGVIPWTPAPVIGLTKTPVQIKGTGGNSAPGGVGGYHFTNSDTAFAYIKFYDTKTIPTVGTTVPVAVLGLPPGLGALQAIGFSEIDFKNGIWVAATALMANNNTTDVTAATIAGTVFYA